MFLSLLHVNVGDDPDRPQPGRLWLRDVYRVHQRLWMAFPDAERRAEDPFFLGTWDGPGIASPKPKRREAGFRFRNRWIPSSASGFCLLAGIRGGNGSVTWVPRAGSASSTRNRRRRC